MRTVSSVVVTGLAIAAGALAVEGVGGPARAQQGTSADVDRDSFPAVRGVVPVSLGVFLDFFDGARDTEIAYLGAGGGIEVQVSGRFGLRGDGQVLLALEGTDENPTFDEVEAFFLPGAVVYLGGGAGGGPHLRIGPALGTSAFGTGLFVGGGVPVAEVARLQGRITISDDGPLLEAGVSLALPFPSG